MDILIGREQHGDVPYASALACLNRRVELSEQYQAFYFDEDLDRAKDIVASANEKSADIFLRERSDHEYEGVQWEKVVE